MSNLLTGSTATSTAVEHFFSRGHQLLSNTCNHLSVESVHRFLCLGEWGQKDLIGEKQVMQAVKENMGQVEKGGKGKERAERGESQ